ncbi:hypothetical protein niasHT_030148 [Heterodera trifolii]|uniref:Uncharacterized protein n=1 Tax=Heterodera trifolii TaxID=157864 RepID=A0ABD2K2V1_9BILA
MANPKYAKEVIEKIEQMIEESQATDQRIDGLKNLIEEHKNSSIRLTELKGKENLDDIPEIGHEKNEINKFDILSQWEESESKKIISELISEIRNFSRELANEFASFAFRAINLLCCLADLLKQPKYLVDNCALLDLARQLLEEQNETENEKALILKIEKRVEHLSVIARLGILNNEGLNQNGTQQQQKKNPIRKFLFGK